MRRVITGILVSALMLSSAVTSVQAAAPIDINVVPSIAPVGPVSPSWDNYVKKAVEAIPLGVDVVGEPGHDPGAYAAVKHPITPLDIVYTGGRGPVSDWFNSWHATAAGNPAFDEWPPAFRDEWGARLHFGLHVVTDGTVDFSLDNLSWELESDDQTNYFDQDGNFAGANYSTTRVGIDYGPDGMKGGGDDIIYDSGEAGSTKVNELAYVGIGDGFFSSEPGLDGQADIDATLTDLLLGCVGIKDCEFDMTGIYSLTLEGRPTPLIGSSSVKVELEPAYGGDLDHNGRITSRDKDIMTNAIAGGGAYNILYDVDGNGAIEFDDLDMLVHDIAGTTFGDANCDGLFNSSDLVQVFIEGKYETGASAVWSSGDFDANGVFDSGDLVLAFTDGGYTAAATQAVPEPSALALTLVGFVMLVWRRRR